MNTDEAIDGMSDDRIVTIARYDQAAPAHIARVLLESAGIPAMVAGENNPGMFVFHAFVGLSVELQVFERDAEAALDILKDGVADDAPASEAACPHCDSLRSEPVAHETRGRLAALSAGMISLAATAPLLGLARKRANRRCLDCGREFDQILPDGAAPGARSAIGRKATPY